ARHERVELIVSDVASEKRARKVLDRANALNDNIRFHRWPTDRVWTRDSGSTFVISIGHVGAGAPTRPARGGHTGGDARAYIERFAEIGRASRRDGARAGWAHGGGRH